MQERNNTITITTADFHRTLRELRDEVRGRIGAEGLPRVYFIDGKDEYGMLLQENTRGFNVSGTLNGAISYQLNTTIFSGGCEIGNVILKIAAAPAGVTAQDFFS